MAEAPESEGREASGKTVDEAVNRALAELGLRRDQVEVTVFSEGRPGILGVGAQPARVLVTPASSARRTSRRRVPPLRLPRLARQSLGARERGEPGRQLRQPGRRSCRQPGARRYGPDW